MLYGNHNHLTVESESDKEKEKKMEACRSSLGDLFFYHRVTHEERTESDQTKENVKQVKWLF